MASIYRWETCISHHTLRWATVPIVKVAQEEKFVDLPSELDVPWTFLRRRYGLESQGGGLMSNYFCNWDANQRLVYQVNTGMPEPIPSAEYALATGFTGSEREVYKLKSISHLRYHIDYRTGAADILPRGTINHLIWKRPEKQVRRAPEGCQ